MNRKTRIGVLTLLALVSLFFRLRGLGEPGLSEDEANKILAVEEYRRGNFTANAEHPMLMKLLCTGSVMFVESWNRLFRTSVPPEAALRFPVDAARRGYGVGRSASVGLPSVTLYRL